MFSSGCTFIVSLWKYNMDSSLGSPKKVILAHLCDTFLQSTIYTSHGNLSRQNSRYPLKLKVLSFDWNFYWLMKTLHALPCCFLDFATSPFLRRFRSPKITALRGRRPNLMTFRWPKKFVGTATSRTRFCKCPWSQSCIIKGQKWHHRRMPEPT
jgi:hypothetical protein